MATVGSHVQGGQVVVGDVVHGHIVLEEKLNTVQMVPLCSHVQWRQSILEHSRKVGSTVLLSSAHGPQKTQYKYEEVKTLDLPMEMPPLFKTVLNISSFTN